MRHLQFKSLASSLNLWPNWFGYFQKLWAIEVLKCAKCVPFTTSSASLSALPACAGTHSQFILFYSVRAYADSRT